jgi:ArsR family transcriptional regulator
MKLEASEIFKVLALETRVKIIELLKSKGPLGSKNIAEIVGITPAAVSQHLRLLRQAGLVRNERKGYWIPYSINEEALENCREVLTEVCTCGCKDACRYTGKELKVSDVESLKKHERELLSELRAVRERIKQITSQKSK